MPFSPNARLTTTLTPLPRLDPDVALVRHFRATADPRVFEALFRKYQTPIFNLVTRMVSGEEAYDLTQEVFYRALRSLTAFKGDCKFSTWLYTIAKNVCLNHLRETKTRAGMESYSLNEEPTEPGGVGGGPEPGDPAADVAKIVETRELQRIVDQVLAQLTTEQRLLMTLRDLEGLSYDEISEITELSLVNVKSKLHRARMAFKSKFQPYLGLVSGDLTNTAGGDGK